MKKPSDPIFFTVYHPAMHWESSVKAFSINHKNLPIFANSTLDMLPQAYIPVLELIPDQESSKWFQEETNRVELYELDFDVVQERFSSYDAVKNKF